MKTRDAMERAAVALIHGMDTEALNTVRLAVEDRQNILRWLEHWRFQEGQQVLMVEYHGGRTHHVLHLTVESASDTGVFVKNEYGIGHLVARPDLNFVDASAGLAVLPEPRIHRPRLAPRRWRIFSAEGEPLSEIPETAGACTAAEALHIHQTTHGGYGWPVDGCRDGELIDFGVVQDWACPAHPGYAGEAETDNTGDRTIYRYACSGHRDRLWKCGTEGK